jgi:hypothetical protein
MRECSVLSICSNFCYLSSILSLYFSLKTKRQRNEYLAREYEHSVMDFMKGQLSVLRRWSYNIQMRHIITSVRQKGFGKILVRRQHARKRRETKKALNVRARRISYVFVYIFPELRRNREFYRTNDVRPPFTYVDMIRQVGQTQSKPNQTKTNQTKFKPIQTKSKPNQTKSKPNQNTPCLSLPPFSFILHILTLKSKTSFPLQ